jgi:hypothetical protein
MARARYLGVGRMTSATRTERPRAAPRRAVIVDTILADLRGGGP